MPLDERSFAARCVAAGSVVGGVRRLSHTARPAQASSAEVQIVTAHSPATPDLFITFCFLFRTVTFFGMPGSGVADALIPSSYL